MASDIKCRDVLVFFLDKDLCFDFLNFRYHTHVCSYALVHLEIKNLGEDAFKHDIYGDVIMLERRITESTSTSVLKDYQGFCFIFLLSFVSFWILDFISMHCAASYKLLAESVTTCLLFLLGVYSKMIVQPIFLFYFIFLFP